jgi:hypothetical protein
MQFGRTRSTKDAHQSRIIVASQYRVA